MGATARQVAWAVLALVVGAATAPVCVAESQFITQRLPGGLQIDVPKSWKPLTKQGEATVKTVAEAAADLAGLDPTEPGRKLVLSRVPDLPPTFASVRVYAVTPPTLLPDEVVTLTPAEINEVSEVFTQHFRLLAQKLGQQMIGRASVAVEKLNTLPALVIHYRRTGVKGPVLHEQIHIHRKELTYVADFSYRESEAGLWKPVIARMRKSIKQS